MFFPTPSLLLLPGLVSLLSFFANPSQGGVIESRQAPNTAYPNNVAQMTSSYNVTFTLLPVSKTLALSLLPKDVSNNPLYNLLTPSGLPNGYLANDQHLLYINSGYQYDIRQQVVQVQELSVTNVYVPFVDVLGNGHTPFLFNTVSYLDFIPASLVGTLTTLTNTQLATFDPVHAAYKSVGSQLSFQVSQGVTVGGIGVNQPRFSYLYNRLSIPYISAATFKSIAAQPYLKTLGTPASGCANTIFLFNETFAAPFATKGTVNTYSPITTGTTTFTSVYGYSASTEWISPPGTGAACSTFA